MSFPWSSSKKEQAASESDDSEAEELRAVENMANKGLAVGAAASSKKAKVHTGKGDPEEEQELQGSGEEEMSDSDEAEMKDKDHDDQPDGEEELLIPLGKNGKPMTEIDLYIHKATEQKRREARIARAREMEQKLERMKEQSEYGTRSGQKKTMQLLSERKQANSMLMTSVFGVVMMMTQLQLSWNGSEMEDNNLSEGVKSLITLSTIYLEYQVYQYYRGYLDNVQIDFNFPRLSLRDSPHFVPYLLESFVCMLHVPPMFNRAGLLSDRFGLWMFIRFYIVMRMWRDGNPVYVKQDSYKKEDINGIYQFEMGPQYFVKFRFWEAPVRVVFECFCVFFFIAVYCFYIVEREKVPHVYDFRSTMWFMAVTMTTVGYDAYTPDDILGRSFAMAGAILAMLILAMTSAILAKFIELQFREQVALGWSMRRRDHKMRLQQAATVIQKFYRMYAVSRSRWAVRRKLHPRAAHQFFCGIN